MSKPDKEYKLSIGSKIHNDLERASIDLDVFMSEVMEKAFKLYCLAAKADEVLLVTDGKIQKIIIK